MTLIIRIQLRRRPAGQPAFNWGEHLDQQRMTLGSIARVLCRTITPRTGAKRPQQIDFRKKFKIIAGPDRAGLHEILAGIAGKASAHEHVENIMHMWFGLRQRHARFSRQGPREIGMATLVVLPPRQQRIGVGVAPRANHIMH